MIGLLYGFVSINNIVLLSSLCFFSAAVLEAIIKIPYQKMELSGSIFQTVHRDFHDSFLFVSKEQPIILKTLMIITVFIALGVFLLQ